MMNTLTLFLVRAYAEGAEAVSEAAGEAAGGHHHEVVIPWGNITVQAFNFAVLFGILFFILRKPIKAHFAERAQTYRELVDRADNARKDAERSKKEIEARMQKLEATAAKGVEQAKTEATEMRTKLMDEAKGLTRRLEQEAQRTAAIEIEKAKAELRAELLEKAIAATEDKLLKNLSSSDQKKLQNEFVEKIETVSG